MKPYDWRELSVEKLPAVARRYRIKPAHQCFVDGTHVQSGDATALVVATGQTTEFGKLSLRIS